MPNTTPNLGLIKPLVTEQYDIAKVTNDNADILDSEIQAVKDDVLDKQDTLVSGTNIKSVNGASILSSGDLELLTKNNPISTGVHDLQGGQIKFPSVQVPSADPNTLDDYEEGTWTPIPAPDTGTITSYTSRGDYTKVGNVVTIAFDCQLTDAGTGAGNLKITGLPFAPKINFLGIVGLEPFNTGVAIYGYLNGTEIQAIKQLTNDGSIIANSKGPSMMFTYLTT